MAKAAAPTKPLTKTELLTNIAAVTEGACKCPRSRRSEPGAFCFQIDRGHEPASGGLTVAETAMFPGIAARIAS